MDTTLNVSEVLPRYAVYVYHDEKDKMRLSRWERVNVTNNINSAIEHAKLLHEKQKYEKIEVKELKFCARKKQQKDKTLRVYEHKRAPWNNLLKILRK